MAGTHDDAMLMMELAKWGAMIGLGDATGAIYSDEFDPATADSRDGSVRTVLIWNETLATLVKNGLLDRELVYDWLYVPAAWNRVKPAALRVREASGVPEMFENFEALAAGQEAGR